MSKLIGITPRLLTEGGVEKQFINTRYIDRLTVRGFNTVLLTLGNPNQKEIFDLCDGFLITGGTDINPLRYGEANDGVSKDIEDRLDQLDKDIIDYVLKHKKPLFGICRGHQSINVFLGGTLHQDLGNLTPSHKAVSANHNVNMVPHPSFGFQDQIAVNSYHHQAIKDLASDLNVLGTHEDGTIEMVMHKSLPIFAVQWHPEINIDSPHSKIIFDAFGKLVNQNSNKS